MGKKSCMCEEQHFSFDKNFPRFWPKLLIVNSQSGAKLVAVLFSCENSGFILEMLKQS